MKHVPCNINHTLYRGNYFRNKQSLHTEDKNVWKNVLYTENFDKFEFTMMMVMNNKSIYWERAKHEKGFRLTRSVTMSRHYINTYQVEK